jgi:MoaA/NifB/PqqE/SkfB family radical SAM enzyme
MSDALFKKIVQELIHENLGHVFLEFMCQNEPLMDEDLFKKIRYIKDKGRTGIITMVVTNGSLFTEEKIHELEQSGLDILKLQCRCSNGGDLS